MRDSAVWNFLVKYASKATAAAAVAGLLLGELFPPLKDYHSLYLAMYLTVIAWTMFEIKFGIEQERERKDSDTVVFKTMRDARGEVMRLLLKEAKKRQGGHVTIVGGRVRSIIEFLREFTSIIENNNVSIAGCDIEIIMMDPDFVASLNLPGEGSDESQSKHRTSAAQMRAVLDEIRDMFQQKVCTKNNITATVTCYDEIPFGYYYLFGEDELLFGGYWWSETAADIVGPSKPCWLVTRRSPEFEAMSEWLRNRVALYKARAAIKSRLDLSIQQSSAAIETK